MAYRGTPPVRHLLPHQGRSVEYALETVVEMTSASADQHRI